MLEGSKLHYVPKEFLGRTGYQIFVDRFCCEGGITEEKPGRTLKNWNDAMPNWWPDEDGEYRNQYFYGGNLYGIISKLDYFQKMGFDLLYLSPISDTHTSHHYDVGKQTEIDPWIGNWETFSELCEKAHQRDILICVDLVFNHMGINSKYFQEAIHNPNSEYHKWFEWDSVGNPIFWYGFRDMPQCNKLNPQYQKYAYDVSEKYLIMGADGIRLDLGENFPREFLQGLRTRVKNIWPQHLQERKCLLVSEMWDFATHKENPQIYGDQVDSVMNYPLSDAICRWVRYGNAEHLEYTLNELDKYPEEVQNVLWNFIDSHDTPRAVNMLAGKGMNENPFSGRIWDIEGPWRKRDYFNTYEFRKWEAENDCPDEKLSKKRLKLASLLQYFSKGIPIVYYGTEVGTTGNKDPFNRKPYVLKQNELYEHYKNLGKIRKENRDIFSQGNVIERAIRHNTLMMVRKTEGDSLILVMNRTENIQENPISQKNTEELKIVYQVGEGTREELKSYSAILYRTSN